MLMMRALCKGTEQLMLMMLAIWGTLGNRGSYAHDGALCKGLRAADAHDAGHLGHPAQQRELLMLMMLTILGTLRSKGAADADDASPLQRDGEQLMLMMLAIWGTLRNMHLLMLTMLAILGTLRNRRSF